MTEGQRIAELEELVRQLRSTLVVTPGAVEYVAVAEKFKTLSTTNPKTMPWRGPFAIKTLLALYRKFPHPLTQSNWEVLFPPMDPAKERLSPNMLRVYVSVIRHAIGRQMVQTVWGNGYAMTPAGHRLVSGWLREYQP